MVLELDGKNFASTIAKGIVIVDFSATWCAPCKKMAPVIEKIAEENKDIVVAKLDIDDSREIAGEYSVLSVPTIIFFKDGEEMDRTLGVVQEQKILDKIDLLK